MESKIRPCTSSANSDPLIQPAPIYPFSIPNPTAAAAAVASMDIDDLLKPDIWTSPEQFALSVAGAGIRTTPPKTRDQVWKDLTAGGKMEAERRSEEEMEDDLGEMTLETFLAKTGVVPEMGRIPGMPGLSGDEKGVRRKATEVVDKVAQQRQRRMIKNRESAARSRERKQAYTTELVSLVTHLEEENMELLRQQEEHKRKRYKQLIEFVIPVNEGRRPRRSLRRTRSTQW